MNRERAQALVEAVVAMPVCVACALTLVDCGVLVRDRIAIAQAADRAAAAQVRGGDVTGAARSALPASIDSVHVDEAAASVTVRGTTRMHVLHRSITQRSSVTVEVSR